MTKTATFSVEPDRTGDTGLWGKLEVLTDGFETMVPIEDISYGLQWALYTLVAEGYTNIGSFTLVGASSFTTQVTPPLPENIDDELDDDLEHCSCWPEGNCL